MRHEPPSEGMGRSKDTRNATPIPPLTPELREDFYQLLKQILPYTAASRFSSVDVNQLQDKELFAALAIPREKPGAEIAERLETFGDIIGNSMTKNKEFSDAYGMLLELEDVTAKGWYSDGRGAFLNAMRRGTNSLAVRLQSKKTTREERELSMRLLNLYSLEGNEQDAKQGIRAILSASVQLLDEMKKDFLSDRGTNTIRTILERGTDEQRGMLRRLIREVLRDPKLDTKSIIALTMPPVLNPVSRDFASDVLKLIVESLGLPSGLITRWRISEESKALGVWDNLKTAIKLEQQTPGICKVLHSTFGLRYFGRYPESTLQRLYDELNTRQPYGIMVYPGVEDARGVFYQDLKMIQKFDESLHSVLFTKSPLGLRIIEAQSKDDMARRAPLLHRRYGQHEQMSFAIISGHGNAGLLQLAQGEPHDAYRPQDIEHEHFKYGKDFFKKGATIILQSCRTGVLLAQRLSRAYPDTFVYAPIVGTYLVSIDRLEKKPDTPELLPTFGRGDVWVLYQGGKLIGYNSEGDSVDTLTKEKLEEIADVCNAIGEGRIPGRSLRRVEQTVYAKRLRSYSELMQKSLEIGEKTLHDIWPHINMIADAATRHIPTARRAASDLLQPHLSEIAAIAEDQQREETMRDRAISSLAYYAHCASGGDRGNAFAMLDKLWPEVKKRIARFDGSAEVAVRYFSAYLQHGDEAGKQHVHECIDDLLKEAAIPNQTLADEFPPDRARRYATEIVAGLLAYWHDDMHRIAQEMIKRLFQGFTESDAAALVDSWMAAHAYGSDRQEAIRRNLATAALLENRHQGSVHSLFVEYGIRNFGFYPSDILRAQYAEGRESKLPHALLLYPRNNIMAQEEYRDHYLMLWNRLRETLGRKGVRVRVAEWGDTSDIARFLGTDAINADATHLVIMGGRGNSREMLYKKGNRWKSINAYALNKKQGRDLFASLKGKTVILDIPCAGKQKRFAQELSKQAQCAVMAPYDSSRLSVIKPTLFNPKMIECDATYGPADFGSYRNGDSIKH